MDRRTAVIGFIQEGHRGYVPHLAVDCVIFGFHSGELRILLLQWKDLGTWSLPGGFIRWGESTDEAASRILRERTGLGEVFLQQFHTFGGTRRNEKALVQLYDVAGVSLPEDFWPLGRVVSIGYLALLDFSEATPTPDIFADEARWWDVRSRPPLMFDHEEMVSRALRGLQTQLSYRPIGFNLLPEKFTMSELRGLYEAILGRTLDRRNFQKKIHQLGIVERLPERKRGGAHRAPYLYRFRAQDHGQTLDGDGGFASEEGNTKDGAGSEP